MTALNLLQLAAIHAFADDGPGEWWWLWRMLIFLIWIAVIALVARWIIRGRRRELSPVDRARGILAERYARGEIDAEEYRQRSDQLTNR